MKIVFWSPTRGRCHTTSSLLALATNLAFVSGLKSCILSTNCSDNFQSALLGKDNEEALDSTVSTFGMDALLRDAKGAALTKNNIEDAAVDLSSKLSIFIPASSKDKKVIEKSLLHNHSVILDALNAIYPLVFIDTKGGFSALNQEILAKADLIVVCLNQSSRLIEDTFKRCEFEKQNCLFLFGDYDKKVIVGKRNIQRKYKYVTSKNTASIPHCSDFANAINEGSVYKWAALNQKCKMRDPNYEFCREVQSASNKLLKLLAGIRR